MSYEEAPPTRHAEAMFNSNGQRLFEQAWFPKDTPKATVAVIHGLAEHGGRYATVADALTSRGYAVHALDLRGHGRSEGARCYTMSFSNYLDDLERFIRRIHTNDRPLFLVGHNLGGTIITLAALTRKLDVAGVVLSAPVLPGSIDLGGKRGRLVTLVSRLAPRTPLVKLHPELMSREPEVVKRYHADPFIYHGRLRAGMITALARALHRIDRDAASFDLPVLLLHGAADPVVNAEATRTFRERISSTDATLKIYEGAYHEVFNDRERPRVMNDLAAWLDQRVDAARESAKAPHVAAG